jgi:hypothetical protein
MLYPRCEPPKTRHEDLPPEAVEDDLGPPEEPVEVRCLHCRNVYSSDRMVWYRGLWMCPHIACGGAGFLFDLYPLDSVMWREGVAAGETDRWGLTAGLPPEIDDPMLPVDPEDWTKLTH